jgi:2-oxoisovalerate ferredoxin oxidoreductase beta subunit
MIKRATGFYETFERKDGSRATHFCPGCGHGIIHKLIAEAMADLGIQDRTVFISPVGCAAFCYYYFDCGNIAGPHGRASAVATGAARAHPDSVVIAYQGDGDLGAIGFNNAFQAANRGEHFACFFVNNSIYAMTGGQMAPTTMIGQKTVTSPYGRDPASSGYPLKVCEVFDQLQAPVLIERVSVADTKRIMQARKAIRRALEIQRDGKGYAFVEILSPCPTNWKMDALGSAEFVTNEMENVFPLRCFRDRSAEAPPRAVEIPQTTVDKLFSEGGAGGATVDDPSHKERSYRFSGFGGQGVLSLGLVVAEAAGRAGRHVSWFPSYGPEQRGGSASCAVVTSGLEIGSPSVDRPEVLVAMNRPALERFAGTVAPGGTIVHEASVSIDRQVTGVRVVAFPAAEVAQGAGVSKAANTAFLGAMMQMGLIDIPEESVLEALDSSFSSKPSLVEKNRKVYESAKSWVKANL